ncbi:MAG TPA: hypothetical protein VFD73_18320 [Gemmatimonadales bacterium]|jgi:hypothetical protein|nr:hypothetical protein [Gemmatimonadales bacterium]
MVLHEPLHPIFSHIGFQPRGIGLAQIDQHQAVKSVREIPVHVEGQEFAADLEVLAQQHRDALSVAFDLAPPAL